MKKVKYILSQLPPSSNHAIRSSRFGYYPTKEYKQFKRYISGLEKKTIEKSTFYKVNRKFYLPLFYKNGNVRKKDLTNMIKYVDDELCKLVGIDDSQILEGTEKKINCTLEYCEWEIEVLKY
jgi:Holliday junction resolvase RusA-like endonuclease